MDLHKWDSLFVNADNLRHEVQSNNTNGTDVLLAVSTLRRTWQTAIVFALWLFRDSKSTVQITLLVLINIRERGKTQLGLQGGLSNKQVEAMDLQNLPTSDLDTLRKDMERFAQMLPRLGFHTAFEVDIKAFATLVKREINSSGVQMDDIITDEEQPLLQIRNCECKHPSKNKKEHRSAWTKHLKREQEIDHFNQEDLIRAFKDSVERVREHTRVTGSKLTAVVSHGSMLRAALNIDREALRNGEVVKTDNPTVYYIRHMLSEANLLKERGELVAKLATRDPNIVLLPELKGCTFLEDSDTERPHPVLFRAGIGQAPDQKRLERHLRLAASCPIQNNPQHRHLLLFAKANPNAPGSDVSLHEQLGCDTNGQCDSQLVHRQLRDRLETDRFSCEPDRQVRNGHKYRWAGSAPAPLGVYEPPRGHREVLGSGAYLQWQNPAHPRQLLKLACPQQLRPSQAPKPCRARPPLPATPPPPQSVTPPPPQSATPPPQSGTSQSQQQRLIQELKEFLKTRAVHMANQSLVQDVRKNLHTFCSELQSMLQLNGSSLCASADGKSVFNAWAIQNDQTTFAATGTEESIVTSVQKIDLKSMIMNSTNAKHKYRQGFVQIQGTMDTGLDLPRIKKTFSKLRHPVQISQNRFLTCQVDFDEHVTPCNGQPVSWENVVYNVGPIPPNMDSEAVTESFSVATLRAVARTLQEPSTSFHLFADNQFLPLQQDHQDVLMNGRVTGWHARRLQNNNNLASLHCLFTLNTIKHATTKSLKPLPTADEDLARDTGMVVARFNPNNGVLSLTTAGEYLSVEPDKWFYALSTDGKSFWKLERDDRHYANRAFAKDAVLKSSDGNAFYTVTKPRGSIADKDIMVVQWDQPGASAKNYSPFGLSKLTEDELLQQLVLRQLQQRIVPALVRHKDLHLGGTTDVQEVVLGVELYVGEPLHIVKFIWDKRQWNVVQRIDTDGALCELKQEAKTKAVQFALDTLGNNINVMNVMNEKFNEVGTSRPLSLSERGEVQLGGSKNIPLNINLMCSYADPQTWKLIEYCWTKPSSSLKTYIWQAEYVDRNANTGTGSSAKYSMWWNPANGSFVDTSMQSQPFNPPIEPPNKDQFAALAAGVVTINSKPPNSTLTNGYEFQSFGSNMFGFIGRTKTLRLHLYLLGSTETDNNIVAHIDDVVHATEEIKKRYSGNQRSLQVKVQARGDGTTYDVWESCEYTSFRVSDRSFRTEEKVRHCVVGVGRGGSYDYKKHMWVMCSTIEQTSLNRTGSVHWFGITWFSRLRELWHFMPLEEWAKLTHIAIYTSADCIIQNQGGIDFTGKTTSCSEQQAGQQTFVKALNKALAKHLADNDDDDDEEDRYCALPKSGDSQNLPRIGDGFYLTPEVSLRSNSGWGSQKKYDILRPACEGARSPQPLPIRLRQTFFVVSDTIYFCLGEVVYRLPSQNGRSRESILQSIPSRWRNYYSEITAKQRSIQKEVDTRVGIQKWTADQPTLSWKPHDDHEAITVSCHFIREQTKDKAKWWQTFFPDDRFRQF